jgi:hypothetical protein
MDDLIAEMLADCEVPRHILDKPIPEDIERRLLRPLQPRLPFIDLDDQVPPPIRLPADEPWVEILNDARAGRLALDAPMTDVGAAQLFWPASLS